MEAAGRRLEEKLALGLKKLEDKMAAQAKDLADRIGAVKEAVEKNPQLVDLRNRLDDLQNSNAWQLVKRVS
jgi:hypothetical protein